MKKTFLALSLIAVLGVGGIIGQAAPVQAAGKTSVQSINSKINSLQDELESATKKLGEMVTAINNTQAEIKSKEQEIAATEEKITTLQNEINTILERVEARSAVLKDRARSLQETGGTISYLEVLLGSQSFSDFITRTEAVLTIVTADQDILEQHKSDMQRVKDAKAELETALASLETMRNELKAKEEQLIANKKELESKEQGLKDQIAKLEKDRSNLATQVTEVSAKSTAVGPAVSLVDSVNAGTAQVSSGNASFAWPTVGGYISSYQGYRGKSFHKGIDIARPSNYSILASRGGTVYYTGWYYTAGLTIKIKHDDGYTTEYSHLSEILVSNGQTVSQGQQIGVMGATGEATGVHLDFKVYQNGKLLNPVSVLK